MERLAPAGARIPLATRRGNHLPASPLPGYALLRVRGRKQDSSGCRLIQVGATRTANRLDEAQRVLNDTALLGDVRAALANAFDPCAALGDPTTLDIVSRAVYTPRAVYWLAVALVHDLLRGPADATVARLHKRLVQALSDLLNRMTTGSGAEQPPEVVEEALLAWLGGALVCYNDRLIERYQVSSRPMIAAALLVARDSDVLRQSHFCKAKEVRFGVTALKEVVEEALQAQPTEPVLSPGLSDTWRDFCADIPADRWRALDPVVAIGMVPEYFRFLGHCAWYDGAATGLAAWWNHDPVDIFRRVSQPESQRIADAIRRL